MHLIPELKPNKNIDHCRSRSRHSSGTSTSTPTEMAKFLLLCTTFTACLALAAADWSQGMATFYGGNDGSGTMGNNNIARIIRNLGGSGSVGAAWVKGDNTGWIQMSRNWGANWQALAGLCGQGLSFAVTSTGGQYIQFLNVIPYWWQFGMAFPTNQNFYY
ncbi:hypothetical protein HU200_049296 [Digitaria exilis]|uniref:Expansin n=1 Tax=Digitaria exilis TaxID=1010633 RepID=A0A835E8I3_9POAL|nr:hypothetical protein HU200_049296 [Digitaria exilis]